MRVTGSGLDVELPTGWEGHIGRNNGVRLQSAADEPTVAHFSNFPMPAVRADFGAEAVETMRAGDVFVALFEYGAESVSKSLFAHEGIPRLAARDFDRNALQSGIPGQSGAQRFFQVNGRAFCIYVVVGSHIDRADVVPQVNALLDSLDIT